MVQKFEMQGGSSSNGDRQTQHGKQKPKCKVDLVFWRPPPRRKWKLRSSAGKGDSSDALSRAFKHWAVLCCLDNGTSYVLDAVRKMAFSMDVLKPTTRNANHLKSYHSAFIR
ncbi:hypothetical protein MRX96_047571 [Rhipicephalus microplus]